MRAERSEAVRVAAVGCLLLAAAGATAAGDDDRNLAVLAKLEEKVVMDFKDAPLGDVLKFVKSVSRGPNDSGIPIHVDPEALRKAGVGIDTKVNAVSKEGEPLKDALGRALRSIGLRYKVEDGLLKVIDGGPRPGRPQPVDRDAKTKAVEAQLARRVELTLKDTPLEEVLKTVKVSTKGADLPNGLPIYVDPVGLQEAGKTMTSPVTLVTGTGTLGDALKAALKSIGLGYTVKDGLLTVTSVEALDLPLTPKP